MPLVGVGRAASVAQRVADVTVGANRKAGLLVLGRGRGWARGWGVVDRCKREGSLAVSQPFRRVESGRWGCVRPGWVRSGGRGKALWPWTAPRRTAALGLHRLDLEPLQLQQPLQVLLQVPHRLGPGRATALCVNKHCQLSQAPAVEGRRQEVRVTVAGFFTLTFIAHSPWGSREVRGKVIGVDDLGPEVEVGRGAGGAGRGQHGQPLRVRQIAGTVSVNILLVVVML